MSDVGFHIVRLSLVGPDIDEAEVRFDKGLNVITGPSDTGKTFILQCIDFMFGGRTTPKEIPEAEPYDTVVMDIKDATGQLMTFKRGLRGGAFKLCIDGEEDEDLGEQHSATNDETLSAYLLKLIGLHGKKVKKNVRNVTRTVSIRDLAHLIIISEEDIIKSASPILSGLVVNATVEKSIFRLLTSGHDDSSVTSIEKPEISKTRVTAKAEVVQEMLNKTQRRLNDLDIEGDKSKLQDELGELDIAHQEANTQLELIEESVIELEQDRQSLWIDVRKIESRLSVLTGLDERFKLLRKQYESDLRRLDAIAESGFRLGELTQERCPICGALPEHHNEEHIIEQDNPEVVAGACSVEASRIRSLIDDLERTRTEILDEVQTLKTRDTQVKELLSTQKTKLQEQLRPQMQDLMKHVRDLQANRDTIILADELLKQIDDLAELLKALLVVTPEKEETTVTQDLSTLNSEAFSLEVEKLLRSWHFPNLSRVTFNHSAWDIDIDGRSRKSHGKGVRAITHAAFTLGLMNYCIDKSLPHSGVVVIDSPLVVYREPDSDEGGFSHDVKTSFLRDSAERFESAQVIILENEDVPVALKDELAINVIQFTGTKDGRRGFLTQVEGQ